MAFSDAGAHVSQMSDASLPTHLLAHWVRDRGDFTIEEAIRMLTLCRVGGYPESPDRRSVTPKARSASRRATRIGAMSWTASP